MTFHNNQKWFFKPTIAKANLILVITILVVIFYTMFWPIEPANYGAPIIQNQGVIYSGQILDYSIHTCRYVNENVLTTITRSLVSTSHKDLQPINLNTDTVSNPARCLNNDRSIILPYSIPSGEYKLVIRGLYSIIPIRRPIVVESQSAPFHVETLPIDREIQQLIDANKALQGQLDAEAKKDAVTETPSSTNTSNGQSTTNKTTSGTTNSSSNSSTSGKPSSSNSNGLIKQLINSVGNPLKWAL